MPGTSTAMCIVVAIAGVLSAPGLPVGAEQFPPESPPLQFRSSTSLVPVDVRVLDRHGRPVTDLTPADFAIFEDGVRQTIGHFRIQELAAADPEPGVVRRRPDSPDADTAPQNHRVFLVVIGRGRHTGAAGALPAAIRFVRERLLPQDQVAVMAFNRATDFTSDHEHIATVLERFRDGHEIVEAFFEHREASELERTHGSGRIPERVQAQIDAIFESAHGPSRVSGPPRSSRQPIDPLLSGGDTFRAAAELLDVPFDEFVAGTAGDSHGLVSTGTGVQYLRHVAGEKHLILLTHRVVPVGEGLALSAAHARVVIHAVQTGGLPPGPMMQGRIEQWRDPADGQLLGLRLPGGGPFLGNFTRDMRRGAAMTGGTSSAFRWVDEALRRVADVTAFSYVLGYYPTTTDGSRRDRRIRVVVNRSGLTVLHRAGYRASRTRSPEA